jgi:hypothetical protein
MDFRKLSDADLKDFAENVLAKAPTFNGTELAPSLTADLTSFTVSFQGGVQAAIASRTQSLADTQVKYAQRQLLENQLAQIKMTMRAAGNPPEDFEAAGFGALDETKTRIIPNAPSDLVVTGDSSNQNYLRWQGNNPSGTVSFVIERRIGDDGDWTYVSVTKRRNFTHQGVQAGQYSEYRVKAVSATEESAYSNSAVIYGQ